jgi:hypothetical protein
MPSGPKIHFKRKQELGKNFHENTIDGKSPKRKTQTFTKHAIE